MDKSCPLCRKPLPPGPDKLFGLGYGMYMKIKGEIDRSRPRVDDRKPWPELSAKQQQEMDQAATMLREAADQGHMEAQARCGDLCSRLEPPRWRGYRQCRRWSPAHLARR